MSDLLNRLSVAALLPQDALMTLVRSAPHRYKIFQVPKRAPGQFRTIAQPAQEVKVLQYWVMKHILSKFEIHQAARAYCQDLSILDNATPHTRGKFLLKMDFKDFFPSLKAHDFRVFLSGIKSDLDVTEIEVLCRILFWMPKGTRDLCLSIGAPTSPMLSNILMVEFDRRISAFCATHNAVYTRYADDLTFSADQSRTLQLVEKAVLNLSNSSVSPALAVNQDKTVRVSRKDSRRVTGLVLTNDGKVSLGRERKRRIRAQMHYFVTDRLETEQILRLRGMLAYVHSVEPSFMRRLRKKYGSDAVRRCLKWTPQ